MQYGMHTHASCYEWAHKIPSFSCLKRLTSRGFLDVLIPLILACTALFGQLSFAATTPGATPGSFSVNESGAANYSIPLMIAPGTGGMQPSLSLQYNSQGGNGLLGMGWSLGGLSAISRCPQTQATDGVRGSVNFDANDRFCLDGQRLIVVSGSYGADGAEYRTEQESFSRVISYGTAGNGPALFKVWTKSGQVMEYGVTSDSRIEAQGKSSVAVWALNKVQDTVGNYFSISYTEDNANGQYYPARIDYTGNASSGLTPFNSVQFVYETRPDITPMYHGGSLMRTTVRLKNVQDYVGTILSKNYTLAYDQAMGTAPTRLSSLTECGGDGVCLLPSTFEWSSRASTASLPAASKFNLNNTYLQHSNRTVGVLAGDFNGDGKSDILRWWDAYQDNAAFLSNGDGSFTQAPAFNLNNTYLQHSNGTVGILLGDFNGDGKSDILRWWDAYQDNAAFLSNGDGSFTQAPAFNLNNTYLQHSNGTVGILLGDFNGDGKTDILRWWDSYQSNAVFLSNGDGSFTQASAFNLNNTYLQHSNRTVGIVPSDFNGDGKTDILRWWDSYPSNAAFLSNGDGSFTQAPAFNLNNTYLQHSNGTVGIMPSDFNGDGRTDILRWWDSYPSNALFLADLSFPDLLVSITTGLNLNTSITYKPLTDNSFYTKDTGSTYPTVDIQAPIYVVSSTSTSNGVGGNYQMTYRYGGMKARQDGRGMLGFRTVTATDPQTGIVSRTEYRQDYPYTGMPVLSTTTSASGVELSRTENSYAEKAIPGGGKFPYLSYSKSQGKDLNGTALPYTETWNESFDDWGNATKITVSTSDGFTTWTNNTYTNDATKWLLGRLTRATVTKSIAGGAAQTRTSAFSYNTINGLLTQEVIEPDRPALRLITDYGYDAYGNKTQVTVSGGVATEGTSFNPRSTSTTYDSKGRFPITTTNALGHTETRVFDERFGAVKSMTGPNALTTTWTYDGFGRKTLETRADGTQTTWSFADCVNACGFAKYSTTVTSSGAPPTVTFYDALRRPVRSVSTGFNGQAIYTDTEYDSYGRVKRSSRPYFANAPIYWTTPTYDELGRTIRVDAPDGTFSTMAYNGLSSVATNPKGQTKAELKNSQGQTVSVTDNAGGITSYKFDAFGNLIETRPAGGGLLVMGYDLRGRKISSTDPDMGYWTYSYNALGELIRQVDAKNQVSTMSYDNLGRIKTRVEPDMTSTWTYDTAAKGIGKLASVMGGGVTKTFTYDTLGRPTRAATVVDGITFNQDSTYDNLGRILTQTRPSGFATKNIYNANGYQTELRNADASNALLWRAVTIDAEGRITQTQYGNGVVNTRTYQAQNGLLTSIQANAPNTSPAVTSAAVQNQSFTYDSLGNLTSRADTLTSGGLTETFEYDNLNRLTQSALTQGGIAQTPVALTYDAIGNITSKTGVGTYTYHATKIHAVVQAGNNAYDYDANGNLIGGAGRAVSWTGWNMPASDSYAGATTSWTYDAEHVRIKQVTGAKTTYYLNPRADLGGHYEEEHYAGGRVDKLHGLYAAGQYIGQITTTNQVDVATKTRYFHTDHLGSISVVTNEVGAVVARYSYDAWGKRQIVVGADEDLHHGYTGHEHLDDGFIHMNGRLYDPVLGRFISADPYIQDASDGQGFNRYSYVNNNPLSFTDPSGYWSLRKFIKSVAKFAAFPTPKNTFEKIRNQPGQEAVDRYIMTHQWAYAVGQIAIGASTWICGGCGAAAWSAYYSYAATGSGNAAFKAALITYATSLAFNAAGSTISNPYALVAAHAVIGCASAAASGGECGAGALSAGVSKLGTIAFNGYDSGIGGLIASSVVGGTASVLAGGKFANGAITGAFGYLFNYCSKGKCWETQQERMLRENGDVEGYWQAKVDSREPFAKTALGVVNNNTALGKLANSWLKSVAGLFGVKYNELDVNIKMMNAYGVDQAKQAAPAVPSASKIQQQHYRVFDNMGLPGTQTFGGTYTPNSMWCNGCAP